MIRKAEKKDVAASARVYEHVLEHEARETVYTGWISGVYPVEATAQAAFDRGELYVFEEETGGVVATAIINQTQVDVYADGEWQYPAKDSEIMVLHTLAVDPAAAGRGIATAFVAFYEKMAREAGCTVLRMDTNAINAPARALYRKLGFHEAGIVPCEFNGIKGVQLVLLEKRLD